jgi:hypothetical protein
MNHAFIISFDSTNGGGYIKKYGHRDKILFHVGGKNCEYLTKRRRGLRYQIVNRVFPQKVDFLASVFWTRTDIFVACSNILSKPP